MDTNAAIITTVALGLCFIYANVHPNSLSEITDAIKKTITGIKSTKEPVLM